MANNEGTPLHGDRSAWNTTDHDGEHARDIDESALLRHLPAPATASNFAVDDGTNWVAKTLAQTGAILETDIEHGNIQGLSTGADHSYLDQTVISGASPTFDGTNFTGIPDGALDTDYVEVAGDTMTGDLIFVGGAGLAFAEIYASSVEDELAIGGIGVANKVQVTSFDTDGVSNNMTPDHTNDHITVTKAGMYLCTVSLHVESAGGGGADNFGFSVYKNNGATEFANAHAHRKLAGGGGDIGSASISGIIDLAVNDTIELWAWNEDSTDNLVIDDATMSLVMVVGT